MKKSNLSISKVLTMSIITGTILCTPFISKPLKSEAKNLVKKLSFPSNSTLFLIGVTSASTIGFGITLNKVLNHNNNNTTVQDDSKTNAKPENGFHFKD